MNKYCKQLNNFQSIFKIKVSLIISKQFATYLLMVYPDVVLVTYLIQGALFATE